MHNWDPVLRELSDRDEYQRDGGSVLLFRHGEEHLIELREIAGLGLAVVSGDNGPTPIATFIQRDLLQLPRLATQITRAFDVAQKNRPAPFVDGPGEYTQDKTTTLWPQVHERFSAALRESEPGATKIVQLMAGAGRGKTVLLESIALDFARNYVPEQSPLPLLLPVDLLGRYVGNIDDAIAGSLNNTFLFPKLAQRDIVVAMKRRWIVLALDGFDELVARVGVRDAFYRIAELLDQLGGSGTIVLSARESFFDLYQITSGIRTYLQPRVGSYSRSVLRLSPWTLEEGRRVFSLLGSPDPVREMDQLREAFEHDDEIALHPFFLTRLADLWRKGERFLGAGGQSDSLARIKYVIDTFIARESGEKWVDRDGNPLISQDAHSEMLGRIAEEMWRTGNFTLDAEELKIAAEIGLSDLEVPQFVVNQVLERVPTHAALSQRGRRFSFLHDRFLNYFLAHRLEQMWRSGDEGILELLSSRLLSPEAAQWFEWRFHQRPESPEKAVTQINRLQAAWGDAPSSENLSTLVASLLEDIPDSCCNALNGLVFVGDVLANRHLQKLTFEACHFWHLDLSRADLTGCKFVNCEFGDVRIDGDTKLKDTEFQNCSFTSLATGSRPGRFAPNDIHSLLRSLGAKIVQPTATRTKPVTSPISERFLECLEAFVTASERTCDVAVEEVATDNKIGGFIVRQGIAAGILRQVAKQVHGPRRQFVRFTTDRSKLLRGQSETTGDTKIDKFWALVREKYPRS